MSIHKNHQKRKEQGQNLLELALVLPFLFVILFGVLDLGRIFFASITLTNAAREGVRYITTHPTDAKSGFVATKNVVWNEAQNGIPGVSITVTASCSHIDKDGYCETGRKLNKPENQAKVDVTYNFDLILGWILPSPITITRSASMVVP